RLRAELWNARRDAYAAATAPLRTQVEELGGRIAYASSSAPLVFTDLPAAAVTALADRPDVTALGLEGTWQPAMSVAGDAVDASWTSGGGDRGNGVRVAVVEYHNVHRSGDLSGTVVKSHSTSGSLAYAGGSTFDHPTWVAGAIAGQSGKYAGVAPGADIVSSGTGGYSASLAYDRRVIAAADWAISPSGGNADVLNTSLVQDTATGAEEARRYFDSVADDDLRLAISAAGNYVNFNGWQIGSPGTGYNVLTVGGIDDRGTRSRNDDQIWYAPGSNGSNWLDRPSDPWNSHGDFNKPNLVAPAVNVRTANGLAASGTSVATPIVSGVAAQMLANEPALVAWPEAARAVLMAGAIHRVSMPDGSRNVDHEGVGMSCAVWTNRVAHDGDGTLGGYRLGSMSAGDHVTQQIQVRAGDRLRVALAWNSHTAGSGNLNKTDVLRSDLDLRVIAPNGSDAGSFTIDNAYEFVELQMPVSGTATIEIRQSRFDGSSETYGLAWAKVRDATRPQVDSRAPANHEQWAVPSTPLRVSFDEPVENVSGSTFTLTRSSTGQQVASSVTYAATGHLATLQPADDLAAGWYEARLSGGITDRAGNSLAATSWTVRVRHPAADTGGGAGRRASLKAGSHHGYHFDAAGRITDSRTVRLSATTHVDVSARAVQPGRIGYWLEIASGRLSGYWVHESSSSGISGSIGTVDLPSGQPLVLDRGTHTGRRFSGASVTKSRTWRASTTTRVEASRRTVINGIPRLLVSGGALDSYWVTESSGAHLPGAVQLTDLDRASASVEAGRRTGRRYYDSGRMRSSKTASIASAQTTQLSAWAIVNGIPRVFALSGRWAGYWISASGVSLK
ncbi:MAG TPA: S8 family serine peptidase, partial [Candidatus Limnocylindria bacterium]|nr:S8 family serine peptidase [Candidatus Limnocylindria bacterium]